MQNPMDKMGSIPLNNPVPNNFQTVLQQALQNPKAFEEQFKRNNPQAYQQACNIRNSYNRGGIDMRTALMQLAQAKGINPSILGLK